MRKLFDENSYLDEFSATVTACIPCEGDYRITLDRTAFFPEAGGQDCDSGTLDGQAVKSVDIENDIIYHTVKNPINIGKQVIGKLDWKERFRKMQHHSAEHIVSGIVHSRFGLDNVGFHLGEKDVTIDYNGEISGGDLYEIERAANEAVWKNIEIRAYYPNPDELKAMSYRSKLELTENVRIVTIEGIDVCACCAPHVRYTGEIGLIKFTDMMRHRGGVRIRMICGGDALDDYEQKHDSIVCISNLLSVKQTETADGTKRILKEISELKQKNSALIKRFVSAEIESLSSSDSNICIFEENADSSMLRMLADSGKSKCGGVFAALSGDDERGYSYVICSNTVNLTAEAKRINDALGGRGGGRDMLSGRFNAKKESIEKFFQEITF